MITSDRGPRMNRRSLMKFGSLLAASGAVGGAVSLVTATPSQAATTVHWKGLSCEGTIGLLNGVTVKGTNAWAVGAAGDAGEATPTAMRLINGAWHATAQPTVGLSSLASVAIVSAREVWAVGEQPIADSADSHPVVVRWNGTRWLKVAFPAKIGGLSEVVSAAGSVWIAGWASVGGSEHAVVYRYTDGVWTRCDKGLADVQNVNCLHVFADGTAWAGLNPGMAHFDGSSWTLAPEWPDDGSMIPSRIIANSTKDLYAAGLQYNGNGSVVPLISHYDGSRWSSLKTPNVEGQLYDVAVYKDRIIAVGERFADDGGVTQLVLGSSADTFAVEPGPAASGGLLALATYDTELLTTGYVDPSDPQAYSAISQTRWTM